MVTKKDDYGVFHWARRPTSVLAECRMIDVDDSMSTEHFRVLHGGTWNDVLITCLFCLVLA